MFVTMMSIYSDTLPFRAVWWSTWCSLLHLQSATSDVADCGSRRRGLHEVDPWRGCWASLCNCFPHHIKGPEALQRSDQSGLGGRPVCLSGPSGSTTSFSHLLPIIMMIASGCFRPSMA